LYKVLCNIEEVTKYTPPSAGESEEWAAILSTAEDNRENYCKALHGKILSTALYGTYTVMLNILKTRSQTGQTRVLDGFKDVCSKE
jgi:hypothetical protein